MADTNPLVAHHVDIRQHLHRGQVIPAHPLALLPTRALDERHQRALTRYYIAAGAGGMAVGVHTTGFPIHDAKIGLYRPVLALAAETANESLARNPRPFVRVAGVIGDTAQAVREAGIAHALGYHCALLSLGAWRDATDAAILAHCARVAEVLPLFGFYLQPAVGGRRLSYAFWREFAEIQQVVAIKVAPFDRYATLDVVRAIADAGREDVALYTGNDDTIVADLLTPFTFAHQGKPVTRRIVGGLLGHWGVWTHAAVQLFRETQSAAQQPEFSARWLERAVAVTDMNAALFDAANRFHGCIPGILEVLRRQGLVETVHCLNPDEVLSPGQAEELTRVCHTYPELTDDAFVAQHLTRWLS